MGFGFAVDKASSLYPKVDFSQLAPGKVVVDGEFKEEWSRMPQNWFNYALLVNNLLLRFIDIILCITIYLSLALMFISHPHKVTKITMQLIA